MFIRFVLLALVCTGSANAALLARDLNGDTVADAYYDTSLNITWLTDAGASGALTYADATAWVAALDVGGYTDWRLPATWKLQGCTPDTADCFSNSPPTYGLPQADWSELAHLFYDLGNFPGNPRIVICTDPPQNNDCAPMTGFGLQHRGPFDNVGQWYWMSERFYWYMDYGQQGPYDPAYGDRLNVWAVRDGDVTPVPEPETWALVTAGLALLTLTRRHHFARTKRRA